MPEKTRQQFWLFILPRFRDLEGTTVILAPTGEGHKLLWLNSMC
jgi:hypothetical protein